MNFRSQRLPWKRAVAILLMFLSGCGHLEEWRCNGFQVGPNYCPPSAPHAGDWIDGDNANVSIATRQMIDWWTLFGDPTLNELVDAAYQQNLSLRAAGLRVLQAREQVCITQLNLLPQSQTFSSSYSRNQLSANAANVFPGVKLFFDDYRKNFDLSWELDVWGRIRRSIQAAEAGFEAEVFSYDDILVTLIGDVAATYIELRSFDERLRLAEQNANIQAGSLRIAEARQQEGRVSELDVEQAKTNLADTQALIPTLRQGRRLALNRLAILLGKTPYELEPLLQSRGMLPRIPEQVVAGIPADLLRRRPDVRAAERVVAARSAQIGIAKADLFPQFALTGQIGLNADSLSDLFAAGSGIGLVAPGFRWNILNYGRLAKNVNIQQLSFQEAIADYQNVVLAAHREVEDGLVQFLEGKTRLAELRKSARASANSVELVQIQYKEGKVDFGRVFVVESALVQRQDQVIATEAEVAVALIRTYKALGGGWQIRTNVPHDSCYEMTLPANPTPFSGGFDTPIVPSADASADDELDYDPSGITLLNEGDFPTGTTRKQDLNSQDNGSLRVNDPYE